MDAVCEPMYKFIKVMQSISANPLLLTITDHKLHRIITHATVKTNEMFDIKSNLVTKLLFHCCKGR